MNLLDKIKLIERTDALIRRKSTGTPNQLADRLKLSERSLYNLIRLMKEMGAPIYYCRDRNSFCYEHNVEFRIGFSTRTNSMIGGQSNSWNNFLFTENNLQSLGLT